MTTSLMNNITRYRGELFLDVEVLVTGKERHHEIELHHSLSGRVGYPQ